MHSKEQIIKELDKVIYDMDLHNLKHSTSLVLNLSCIKDFFNENELWDKIVVCGSENITYFLIYALCVLAAGKDCGDVVTDFNKYYEYGVDWVNKNREHYTTSNEKGFCKDVFNRMLVDFVNEIEKILKKPT